MLHYWKQPSILGRIHALDEPLVSVHVEIPLDLRAGRSLPLGSIVRLPRPFPIFGALTPNLFTQNTWATDDDSED